MNPTIIIPAGSPVFTEANVAALKGGARIQTSKGSAKYFTGHTGGFYRVARRGIALSKAACFMAREHTDAAASALAYMSVVAA